MLTVAQEIVIEQFARELVARVQNAIKNKPVNRTSVRYKNGERTTSNFTATVNNTGALLRSITFEITDTQLIIYGADHAYFLIYGRKPSQKKSGSIKQDITAWVRSKGIVSQEITESQLVYLITRKIHREGNSIYIFNKRNNFGSSGLFDGILTKQILDDFNAKFTAQLISELSEEFVD